MEQLNSVFELFFYQFCNIAKFIFAIRMASDIIKKGNDGDVEGIIRALISGGIGYGSLYAIISILDAVQNSFK